jgi:hypothetical protein
MRHHRPVLPPAREKLPVVGKRGLTRSRGIIDTVEGDILAPEHAGWPAQARRRIADTTFAQNSDSVLDNTRRKCAFEVYNSQGDGAPMHRASQSNRTYRAISKRSAVSPWLETTALENSRP